MPRKLAVYWLAYGAGLKNTEIGALVKIHPARVSQVIKEVRKKASSDGGFREVMMDLERRVFKNS